MANRLSSARVQQAWEAFQERQSADYVSKKCGIHWRTVDRYRRLERWDDRLAEIRARAQAEADTSLASALAASLKLVRRYKGKLAEALEGKQVAADDVTAAELEKVIKLEAFVLGGAEHRAEVVGRFSDWTNEELEAFARDGVRPR